MDKTNCRLNGCDGSCCKSIQPVWIKDDEYFRFENGPNKLEKKPGGYFMFFNENGCGYLGYDKCLLGENRPQSCKEYYCK